MTDHPRSCGANYFLDMTSGGRCGSSPLVRGQRHRCFPHETASRIIPARAGPTFGRIQARSQNPDHPRSCGANTCPLMSKLTRAGSSPLVRGQQPVFSGHVIVVRIIPARAGPTRCIFSRVSTSSDHPRSCGANDTAENIAFAQGGSSPLVRGQLRLGFFRAMEWRIIPARAGPTARCWPVLRFSPDHPRSCGANRTLMAVVRYGSGSSPLVRGQLDLETPIEDLDRIIPARAGPTLLGNACDILNPDHPRSCGANAQSGVGERREGGSSPLVRGQRRSRTRDGA